MFAKGNIALAEKLVAFDKRHVALAEKFIAVAKRNVALAEKFVPFANCNVALAEKLVAFCLDFLKIRKRPKTSHAPAIVAAWSLPLSTPSGERRR